jgi:hypothetical protein
MLGRVHELARSVNAHVVRSDVRLVGLDRDGRVVSSVAMVRADDVLVDVDAFAHELSVSLVVAVWYPREKARSYRG